MKKETLYVAIVVIAAALFIGFMSFKENPNLGNIFTNPDAYSGGNVAYSTSSVGLITPVQVLARATSSRRWARVCHIDDGAGVVFAYKRATSTSVVIDQGNPLYSSSTNAAERCISFGSHDPYIGAVWAISKGATTTVGVEAVQE